MGTAGFRRAVLAVCFVGVALLQACTTAPQVDASVWDDTRFAASTADTRPEQVWTLSPALQTFVDEQVRPLQRRHGARDGLYLALRDHAALRLEYDAERTRNASEAFEARAGNCLSLVALTAALARHLGVPYEVNEVHIAPVWSRSASLVMLNGHVNLSLGSGRETARRERLTLDFVPIEPGVSFRSQSIDDARVAALFLNNRAVEAMERGQAADAYAYLRSAARVDPSYLNVLNTLGVLYRRQGATALAERAWQRLIDLDPGHVHAMANLERLLRDGGRAGEASALALKREQRRDRTPFAAYALGLAAAEREDWATARRHFERELSLAPQFHELRWWLARTYWALGDRARADAELARAQALAPTVEGRRRYQAKLEALRALAS